MLRDIAILTGGNLIAEELGMKFENITPQDLGHAKSVSATKDTTIIIGGAGEKSQIDDRVSELKTAIENTDSKYEREKLAERLAKLAGGVAVIKV